MDYKRVTIITTQTFLQEFWDDYYNPDFSPGVMRRLLQPRLFSRSTETIITTQTFLQEYWDDYYNPDFSPGVMRRLLQPRLFSRSSDRVEQVLLVEL